MGVLNLRSAHRAVAGGEPGAEGNVTKLLCQRSGTRPLPSWRAGPDLTWRSSKALARSAALALAHGAMSIMHVRD